MLSIVIRQADRTLLDEEAGMGRLASAIVIQGHSIGRWEGDTLIIDTSLFSDHALGNAFGVPSGSQKHLLERLSLNADGKSLTYEFELTDPEFLAAPISAEIKWAYRPDLAFSPEDCDPENARRFIDE